MSTAPECNVENMRIWVAALRDGTWKQARGRLYQNCDRGYCCLGVACELAHRSGIDMKRVDTPSLRSYGGMTMLPPHDLTLWLGTDYQDGGNLPLKIPQQHRIKVNFLTRELAAALNDDHRFTFAEIADCIEYTYLPGDWEQTMLQRQPVLMEGVEDGPTSS